MIDGRNVTTTYDYDSRGRKIRQKQAQGTADEAITEWDYDVAGNVTEVRSPRYFASGDSAYQKAKTTTVYNGRNLPSSATEAPGQPEAATTSTTYDLKGRAVSRTDARGNVWQTIFSGCCGQTVGQKDPAGHGSISNSNPGGQVVHTATVEDFDSHTANYQNPIDAKTLAETTIQRDALGRAQATTRWLVPRGAVDPENVPIAGLGGVSKSDGLTSQTFYDDDLTDNVGLDSTTGLSVSKLGGGTYNISIAQVISKVADTPANGGAGLTFGSGADGAATDSMS